MILSILDRYRLFLLLIFPKKYSISTIFMAFTMYWVLKVIKKLFKVFGKMFVGYKQILHYFI